MELTRYTDNHKKSCLDIFRSNCPKFFADWEYGKFESFLESHAVNEEFFVLIHENNVIGCGGYEESGNAFELTWGMIHSSLHRQKYGTLLLKLRIEKIRQHHGTAVVKIATTQEAEGFFAKQGFKALHRIKDGFGKGLDQVDMVLD